MPLKKITEDAKTLKEFGLESLLYYLHGLIGGECGQNVCMTIEGEYYQGHQHSQRTG